MTMRSTTINNLLPGLQVVRNYRSEWFSSDLLAGLSVAAVALPIGIAYAQLAGFPPVVGIYSCVLPPVAYALFGSSRQLIVNPDAAACAIVASTVAPLAAGDPGRYLDLAIALTLMTGVLCIAGGLAGFGAIANFLSRPILTGYLNGIALSIIVGQLGKLFGFDVPSAGFFRTIAAVALRINETHFATAAVGISFVIVLVLIRRYFRRIPGPLIAAIGGIAIVYFWNLSAAGVATVGEVPPGFRAPQIPSVHFDELSPLLLGSAGIVLVSFCSMMTTARGFAAKNGYSIDANRDMAALGVCDLASGFTHGFVVSGADSRTAVADSSGGKSQVTGLIAAAAMAAVLMFFTAPLAFLPIAALAAILVSSAFGLFDFESLRRYYRLSKPEFRHSIIAMLGVMTIGVLPGVLVAVTLAILNLLRNGSHPHDALLTQVEGVEGVYDSEEHGGGPAIDGLIIYRFDASLLFFNSDHFKERVRTVVTNAETKPSWFLLDAEAMAGLDVTGSDALESLHDDMADRGIVFAIARAKGRFRSMLELCGLAEKIGSEYLFPTVHAGALAFHASSAADRAQVANSS